MTKQTKLTRSTTTIQDRRGRDYEINTLVDGHGGQYLIAKTRHGKKTHMMSLGSSVLECGYWTTMSAYSVYAEGAKTITCEKCMAEFEIVEAAE